MTAHALIGGGLLLPVHWGTFSLAVHAWDEPAEQLMKLAPARGARLVMPRLGEAFEPARAGAVDPWWRAIAALERDDDPVPEPKPEERDAAITWPLD